MADNQCLNCSDEDEDSEFGYNTSEIQGTLNKWTNYIHGWQQRFIVLKNGTLSYYKSEEDSGFGCRGSISLFKATIKPHEFDECRFDITLNDCTWYLRADSAEERRHWVEVLEGYKAESAYGSENSLKRHGSSISLQSNTLSSTSASSFKRSRGLREKLAEMDTYKDILCNQMDLLQTYFDKCAEVGGDPPGDNMIQLNGSKCLCHINPEHGVHAVDFKGEAITFKATTSAVLTTLNHCLDLFNQKEELWKKKIEKEIEKRRKIEELYRIVKQEINSEKSKVVITGGPDLEEGPHSRLKDEEFYDAVETSLDKIDEDEEFRERLKSKQILASQSPNLSTNHSLWPEIERITAEQIRYALQEVGSSGSDWHLFAEEGEMKLFKREQMVDGMVMDPLKACHIVRGVTGHEICHYFFTPSVRMEWETTLDSTTVLEKIDENTLVFYQVHRRIWPASQRDAIFWSHKKAVPNQSDPEGHDIWTVTNHSVDLPEIPANTGKTVRIYLTVCLLCQTFVDPPKNGTEITRDNLRCKITYCSVINPGGWAPAAALRQVYKREYPKFVKRFTAYVVEQCKNKPILF